jgi:hypothetical protein
MPAILSFNSQATNEHTSLDNRLTLAGPDVRFCRAYTFDISFFNASIFKSIICETLFSMSDCDKLFEGDVRVNDGSTDDTGRFVEYSFDFLRFSVESEEE